MRPGAIAAFLMLAIAAACATPAEASHCRYPERLILGEWATEAGGMNVRVDRPYWESDEEQSVASWGFSCDDAERPGHDHSHRSMIADKSIVEPTMAVTVSRPVKTEPDFCESECAGPDPRPPRQRNRFS